MLGLRLSWEDEREKHNSWKRPRACGTLRFHELCFSLSSSHESRKPNIHFLIISDIHLIFLKLGTLCYISLIVLFVFCKTVHFTTTIPADKLLTGLSHISLHLLPPLLLFFIWYVITLSITDPSLVARLRTDKCLSDVV